MLGQFLAVVALVLMLGFVLVLVHAVPPTARVRAIAAAAPVLTAAGAVVVAFVR